MSAHRGMLVYLVAALAPICASRTLATEDACAGLAAPAGVAFSTAPAWVHGEDLPRYCRVRGTVDERVNFEMRLPAQWNGRFLMAGCGGFCGELLPDKPGRGNTINEALKRGYAGISHDSGHQAKSWETHWASDPVALELWAHKVLPVITGVGTQLATSLYGRPPDYRYFSGCSNGGRLGLMAAQRYPELFDGIAAGAGIFELSGIAGLWGNWLIANNQAGPDSRFPQAKLELLERFVMARCDDLDGQADGLVDDPRACRVDFGEAACEAGSPSQEACFTPGETAVLNRLYGGVRDGGGEVVYPSVAYGSEHYAGHWLFGAPGQPAWGALASAGYRQMLAADLGVEDAPEGLPTDTILDWLRRSSIPALTDANDPDLSGLRASGTRLLVYQGWSDPLIIPQPITRYYEEAIAAAGGLASLQSNARLFMIPGWGHCWEKPAAVMDDFDPLLTLEHWVEQGEAPDSMLLRKLDADGAERRARPVCAYPRVARLRAGGDGDKHQDYQCVDYRAAAGS